jgi:hypothetical protein
VRVVHAGQQDHLAESDRVSGPSTSSVTRCVALPWPWPWTATVTNTVCWPAVTDWLSGCGACVCGWNTHWWEIVPAEPLVWICPVTSTAHPLAVRCMMSAPVTWKGACRRTLTVAG